MKKNLKKLVVVAIVLVSTLPLGAADCCPAPPFSREGACQGLCSAAPDCGTGNVCDDGQCIAACVDETNQGGVVCHDERPVCGSDGALAGVCICDETSCGAEAVCDSTTGNCTGGEGEGEGLGEGEGEGE
jgi:hypothetical protein